MIEPAAVEITPELFTVIVVLSGCTTPGALYVGELTGQVFSVKP